MLFWLVTVLLICTATALESEGRELAVVNIANQGDNLPSTISPGAAPGSIFVGGTGGTNTANAPVLSLDSNGGFAGFTGTSQNLGNGVVVIESPQGGNPTVVFDLPCGGNITYVRGRYEGRRVFKDSRCGKATVIQTPKNVIINSPTQLIGSHSIISPCGGVFTTAKGTAAIIYVDEINCARDPSGSVDGVPFNCSCGCEGVSHLGTEYKIGRAPSCPQIPTMAGGSTVIINNHPDINADPLGLFPFVNVNNAPHEGGVGFGGFPGGFGGSLGGYNGYPGVYGGFPGGFGGYPGGFGWFPGGHGR